MNHLLEILIVCSVVGCSERRADPGGLVEAIPEDTLLCAVDTSGFVVLPYEQSLGLDDVVQDSLHPLSLRDFEKVECLLAKEVQDWNLDSANHYHTGDRIDLQNYGRAYCALTNGQGHRLVYLNAFCSHRRPKDDSNPPFNKHWVLIADGGHCYFQALFDLDNGSVISFMVNGEA